MTRNLSALLPGVQEGHRVFPEEMVLSSPFGDIFYVDGANGSDTANSGTSPNDAFKSLGQAHDSATSNNGDVIYLNGSSGTALQESEMLTWSKSRISVIGIGPAGAVDPQPEIQLTAGANANSNAATMKVTGYGNSFTNCYISNSGTHADSVTALWDAGENNVYTNCQTAKFSDLNESAVSDCEARGDTTTWRNCKFGVDWVKQTAARATFLIKGTGGGARMKHNIFEDCYFVAKNTQATKLHIKVYDGNSLAFTNIWKNCIFNSAVVSSESAVQSTDVVGSHSGLIDGTLFFVNPASNGLSFCGASSSNKNVEVLGPGMMAHNAGTPVIPTPTIGVAITPD